MILKYMTIILFVISLMCIVAGELANKKIIIRIGYGILGFIIIFWFGFFIYALEEEDKEFKSQMSIENNTSNEISISNQIIDNNISEVKDITGKMLNGTYFKNGKIYKIDNQKLYFINNEGSKFSLQNNEQIDYIDGRTGTKYKFEDIKENYFIDVSFDKKCYIFKNISGEELKKELLISLSLSDEYNMYRTGVGDIQKVQQLGNNEALVTFTIYDLITPENYPVSDTQSFEVTFKFTNDTVYHSKGKYTYNAETIEYSKDTIMVVRLDDKTLNYQYPEVLNFISDDT